MAAIGILCEITAEESASGAGATCTYGTTRSLLLTDGAILMLYIDIMNLSLWKLIKLYLCVPHFVDPGFDFINLHKNEKLKRATTRHNVRIPMILYQ